jgi:outer membrane lipoprotein-sorting protein
MKKITLLALALFFSVVLPAQSAQAVLNGVYKKFQKVKDYQADANVRVDIPFLKMMPINAKVYFKQKDKFRVVSTSIAILPKQNINQMFTMMADSTTYTAVSQGTEKIGTVTANVVSIIPVSDTSDLVLGKFWIDNQRNIILKSQLTTRSNGTILSEYTYGKYAEYGLPDGAVFTVDVKKFKIPKAVAADLNNSDTPQDDKTKDNKKGKIYLTVTNYIINKGVSDDVFKK